MSQLANVRAEKLQELVYKQGNSGVTKASVTIKFDNSNKAQSPPGYTDSDVITVCRTIENQKSKYYVNAKIETAEKVKSLFCSVKLNVNNPHFLIMQGRVTKVINMKPPEILGLIEEAAGISLYQTKKEQTLALIKKKDLKLQEINKILDEEVSPQLEALRKEKDDYALFKHNESQMEELDKVLIAFEYYENDKIFMVSDKRSAELKVTRHKFENEIHSKQIEVDNIKQQIANVQINSNKGGSEEKVKGEINLMENEILTMQLERDRLAKEEGQWQKVKAQRNRDIDEMKD